jgi:hypothetical protein
MPFDRTMRNWYHAEGMVPSSGAAFKKKEEKGQSLPTSQSYASATDQPL